MIARLDGAVDFLLMPKEYKDYSMALFFDQSIRQLPVQARQREEDLGLAAAPMTGCPFPWINRGARRSRHLAAAWPRRRGILP